MIVNNLDDLSSKYNDHARTPYVKKSRTDRKGKKGEAETAPKKSRSAKSNTAEKSPKKTTAKKTRTSPTMKLTPELADVLGSHEMSRADVLKKIWEYIKSQGLQDSANKRLIKPDAKLAKVFGSKEPLDMFKMAGILNKHMEK